MPDGHNQQCYRVRIECGGGRALAPVISAESPTEARAKAAELAKELCRRALPWEQGAKHLREDRTEPVITDVRRSHRWWTE